MLRAIWLIVVLALVGTVVLLFRLDDLTVVADASGIQPGTYTMEWRVGDGPWPSGVTSQLVALSAAEAKGYKGLRSNRCLIGRNARLDVILDESKGTRKGYDTAYVIPAHAGKDLSKAVKLPLLKEGAGKNYSSDRSKACYIELPVGDPKSGTVLRWYRVSASALLKPKNSPDGRKSAAWVTLLGKWHGRVRTSEGELGIQPVDMDGNGIYGEKVRDREYPQGDAVIFGEINPRQALPGSADGWEGSKSRVTRTDSRSEKRMRYRVRVPRHHATEKVSVPNTPHGCGWVIHVGWSNLP